MIKIVLLFACLFQVFVETLDKCFENVCELDLIFHMDKVSLDKWHKSKDWHRVLTFLSPTIEASVSPLHRHQISTHTPTGLATGRVQLSLMAF